MTAENSPERKHLVVGEGTKDVPLGSKIVGGDPSATRFTVKEVDVDTGKLIVEIEDLIGDEPSRTAPIPIGTPVIIETNS